MKKLTLVDDFEVKLPNGRKVLVNSVTANFTIERDLYGSFYCNAFNHIVLLDDICYNKVNLKDKDGNRLTEQDLIDLDYILTDEIVNRSFVGNLDA